MFNDVDFLEARIFPGPGNSCGMKRPKDTGWPEFGILVAICGGGFAITSEETKRSEIYDTASLVVAAGWLVD